MSTDKHNTVLQTQVIAQWITSLAISVICCAILFIVFAGYIVKLQNSNNLLTVKIEYLEERYKTLADEVSRVHRAPQIVQIMARQPVPAGEAPMVVPALPVPDAEGMGVPTPVGMPSAVKGEPKAEGAHATAPETAHPVPITPSPLPANEQESEKTRPSQKFESIHPAVMHAPSVSSLPPDTATGKGHPSAGIEEGIVVPAESEQVDLPDAKEPAAGKSQNFTTKSSTK